MVPEVRRQLKAVAGSTRRQQLTTGVTAAIGVLTGTAALGGRTRLCGLGVAAIVSADLLVGLELRRRVAALELRAQGGPLKAKRQQADQADARLHLDGMLRRILAAVEFGRLEAADRCAESAELPSSDVRGSDVRRKDTSDYPAADSEAGCTRDDAGRR